MRRCLMQHPSLWWASTSPLIIILAQLYGSLKIDFMPLLNPRSWCQTQALLTTGVLPPGHTGRIRGKSVTQGRQTWLTVEIVSLSSWAVKSMWASFLAARGSRPIVVVQSLSRAQLFVTPGTVVCQASLSLRVEDKLKIFLIFFQAQKCFSKTMLAIVSPGAGVIWEGQNHWWKFLHMTFASTTLKTTRKIKWAERLDSNGMYNICNVINNYKRWKVKWSKVFTLHLNR